MPFARTSRIKAWAAVLMTLGQACLSYARAEPLLSLGPTSFSVAGWAVGENVQNGGCLAVASYQGGTTLWVGFDKQSKGILAMTNEAWRSIEPGQKYRIRLRARGMGNWDGIFTGFQRKDEKGIFIQDVKTRFLVDFAYAGGVVVMFEGRDVARLNLAGSNAALNAVADCQKVYVARAGGGEGTQAGAKREDKPPASESKGSSGTGFFVSSNGHVLTNNHVVEDCKEFQAGLAGEPMQVAQVVATDKTNDLAVLSTSFKPALVPAFNTRTRVGEPVFVYGFPLSGILASSGNFTTGNITALAGMSDDTRMFQISAPVQPGNSGGPVSDQSANVNGVVVSKLNALRMARITDDVPQNVNFIIKASIAVNFLESNGIAPVRETKSQTLGPAEIAEQAKKFTVRVVCR